jgi:hypothetical protein
MQEIGSQSNPLSTLAAAVESGVLACLRIYG